MQESELCLPPNAWGVHVSVDFKNGNNNVCDYIAIKAFGEDLVNSIGMEAYGSEQIVHFGKDDKQGYTYSQLITTSNICCHFVEDFRGGFLDVFSCKNVTVEAVQNIVERWFAPQIIKSRRCVRGIF